MRYILAIALAASFGFSTGLAFAETRSISGTHGKNEIKSTCADSGGSFYSNLDGYGCVKQNCDGKNGTCTVGCDSSGNCLGQTPARRLSGKTRSFGPKTILNLAN